MVVPAMMPATVELKFEMVEASWVPVWFARSWYQVPSCESKVPDQLPVRSRVSAPAVFRRPEPVRSVKVSALTLIPEVNVARPPKRPVPVAVKFASFKSPEKRAEPWRASLNAEDADVVAIPSVLEKYEVPNTSRMLFAVLVALAPKMSVSEVSVG